jgi:hypothetical protein
MLVREMGAGARIAGSKSSPPIIEKRRMAKIRTPLLLDEYFGKWDEKSRNIEKWVTSILGKTKPSGV